MNTRYDKLTYTEAVELVQKELDMSYTDVRGLDWLKKLFTSTHVVSRAAVMDRIEKIQKRLSGLSTWGRTEEHEGELSR